MHAIARAAGSKWTQTEELLALIAEILHQLLIVTAKAYGAKDTDLPEPLRIPRPYDGPDTRMSDVDQTQAPPDGAIGFAAFAAMVDSDT